MDTMKIAEEAEKWVAMYSDAERDDIEADLLNAFHEGAKVGARLVHEGYERVVKDMLPFVVNNRKQDDRNTAAHQLQAVIEKLSSNAGNEGR